MPRRLIVCSDGTWNDENSNTNVFKLRTRLAQSPEQIVFYDPGVGTASMRAKEQSWLKNTFDRIGGGAFGAGLSGNVQEAYSWLCEHYQDNDELWFFGFSRGAFTVRSTVGFIRKIGLLPGKPDDKLLEEAYDLYRRRDHKPDMPDVIQWREAHGCRPVEQLNIAFIGVWDTVGALGVPGLLAGRISRDRFGFHDLRLSSHVKHAYQALAVDELRAAFLPAPWVGPFDPDQTVEQVWFAGDHGDVGGAKGDLALAWIAGKAQDAGLTFQTPVATWPVPGMAAKRLGDLRERSWRILCGQAARPVGATVFGAQAAHPSLMTLYDSHPDYRPQHYTKFVEMMPLDEPIPRTWFYTLPGANKYYLDQYRKAVSM